MQWIWKKFSDLSTAELYSALHLRESVFVVEQNCVYLDCDGFDQKAWHLLGYQGDILVAYLRAFPPGQKYAEVSLGRLATAREFRGRGLGRALTSEGISRAMAEFGNLPIRISAQSYLQKFYESFSFIPVGEPYLEDGIPHLEMLRSVD